MIRMESYYKSFPVTSSILLLNTIFFILISTNILHQNTVVSMGGFLHLGSFFAHFSHFDILHFAMNMVITYRLFPLLEYKVGSQSFFNIFLGLWFGLVFLLQFISHQPLIGFSGILMGGLTFLLLNLRREHHPFSQSLLVLVGANIFIGLLPGISFWGHFGGAFVGAVLFFLMLGLKKI